MVNLQNLLCFSIVLEVKAPHAWRGIKAHFHILILLEWNLNIMKDQGTGKICPL